MAEKNDTRVQKLGTRGGVFIRFPENIRRKAGWLERGNRIFLTVGENTVTIHKFKPKEESTVLDKQEAEHGQASGNELHGQGTQNIPELPRNNEEAR